MNEPPCLLFLSSTPLESKMALYVDSNPSQSNHSSRCMFAKAKLHKSSIIAIYSIFSNNSLFERPTNADLRDTLQFFNSWVLNKPSGIGVSTHSPPNDIATLATSQAVNGTPSLSIPAGSKIKSFDLSSFWFGCALDTVEGLVGKATQCTIDVAGFRKGQEVAVASFTFTPPVTGVSVPQIQAVFPDRFVALENVTIIQDDPALNVLVADNFQITTHS